MVDEGFIYELYAFEINHAQTEPRFQYTLFCIHWGITMYVT